jgi:hypothetical protein
MPFTLSEDEREFVAAEARSVREWLSTAELRLEASKLVVAAREGELEDGLVGALEVFLKSGLETGRIIAEHGQAGEAIARRLCGRLPHGRALNEAATAVTQALAGLRGHTIQEIAVGAHGPGAHSVTLVTDQARLTVQFDRNGARLRTVEVG